MNNQVDSAKYLGLHVETINSGNSEKWDSITEDIKNNKIDALIISPERLSNDEFKKLLINRLAAQVTLFVVDEAHCISDWGHDFRPDYRRIVDIINILPSNIPVLATTATANNRVVEDIKKQLGHHLNISRGSLIRESLAIQVIDLNTKEERLAWILDNIEKLQGTGIIYCLTVNDCKLVDKWLSDNGILSKSYYADISPTEKSDIIDSFMGNKIKALVATVAFGMGFDKSDIGFVIHFQKPGNIVAYYQQELNTSYLQYGNAYGSFEVRDVCCENVLLVDDMVDSRWTFTVCGYKLRKQGSGKVFPYALADTAGRNGDE